MTGGAAPRPDDQPLDVWSPSFIEFCRTHGIAPPLATAEDAASTEADAARFVLCLLRSNRWLRRRFSRALCDGILSRYVRWLEGRGRRKLRLTDKAVANIRRLFAHSLGQRIVEIYLRDAELQRIYPLALSPLAQRGFVQWLVTHGRADQAVRDEEILWFLHASTEQIGRGIALSYLSSPLWQQAFPCALTKRGWKNFRRSLAAEAPHFFATHSLGRVPNLLTRAQQQYLAKPKSRRFCDIPGVNFLSHFCYPSGIQQAAVHAKNAFEHCGIATSCRDVPVALRADFLPREDWLGLEIFPFTIINVAPTPYFDSAYERSGLLRRDGVYRVAYWAWELETVPDEWLALKHPPDEIWAPTPFVAKAMRSRMPMPVIDMLPGVEVPNSVHPVSRENIGIPPDHFLFLFMFDMYSEMARKNPIAVIRAFRAAFRPTEKASLVIKVSRGEADAEALARLRAAAEETHVVLIDAVVPRDRALGYLAMCDCFVSLHRSEGFALGLAEAMLLGKPTIGTAYSGNLAFMHAANSFLVGYELRAIERSGPIYRAGAFWAEPSISEAAHHMRYVFENRDAAAQIGARARAELREKLSLRAAGERMRKRLRAIN